MTDTGKWGWGWFWAFVGVGAAGAVAVLGMLTIFFSAAAGRAPNSRAKAARPRRVDFNMFFSCVIILSLQCDVCVTAA